MNAFQRRSGGCCCGFSTFDGVVEGGSEMLVQRLPNRVALWDKSSRDSLLDRRGAFTTALVQVFRATKAGAVYAIIVFLIGFTLGTIRVLLVAPRLKLEHPLFFH